MFRINSIVFIHGLNGHRERTWTDDRTNTCWPRDLLPDAISNGRILSYGYDADTHGSSPLSVQTIYRHATTFVGRLSQERLDNPVRINNFFDDQPVLKFLLAPATSNHIYRALSRRYHCEAGTANNHSLLNRTQPDAHSKALLHCNAARPDLLHHLKSIKFSTYGILFFGTPHRGANNVALGRLILGISSIFMHTNTTIVRQLDRDSDALSQLVDEFLPIIADFQIIFFYETHPTPLIGGTLTLVQRLLQPTQTFPDSDIS
jgi:hypothetical protein